MSGFTALGQERRPKAVPAAGAPGRPGLSSPTTPGPTPQRFYQSGTYRGTCMRLSEGGWFSLYKQAAKGTRTLQEFEEIVLRRFEMLAALHQEEGLERMSRDAVVREVTLASRGDKTVHSKGVFEWVSPHKLESLMLTEDFNLRFELEVSPQMIQENRAKRRSETDMYSGSTAGAKAYSAYTAELQKRKSLVVDDLYKRAFEDDSISHWACRLACCGEEKWRSWLVKHEATLFRGRVLGLSFADQQSMLRTHTGLQAIPLADLTVRPELCQMLADLERKQEKLRVLDGSDGVGGGLRNTYYAVDFMEVPHMVGRKMVILRDGVAYVNHLQALDVLVDRFKGEVEKGLVDALRARPDVEATEKDRVSAFLQKAVLESMQAGNKTKDHSVGIDIEDIVTYADRNMPLCMRSMDRALRSDRHLKFDGRFQYGLFLKHAGLTLEQAMKFFSQTMTLKVTTEKFAKSEFGYSVRHWYGKEGKKTSYNALNCSSLIMGAAPRAGQTHGCPFKHFTEAKLKAALKEPRPYGPVKAKQATLATRTVSLRDTAVDEILKKSSTGHHAAACREYFAQMHTGYPKESSLFTSPNHYLQTSLEWQNPAPAEGNGKPANGERRTGLIGDPMAMP